MVSFGYAHEQYKNPAQLTPVMQLVMAKRNCVRHNQKIKYEKVSDVMRDLRKLADADKKLKMNPAHGVDPGDNATAAPSTRVAGTNPSPPVAYRDVDYVGEESELRHAAHGPWDVLAEILPHNGDTDTTPSVNHPESNTEEWLRVETKRFAESIRSDASSSF